MFRLIEIASLLEPMGYESPLRTLRSWIGKGWLRYTRNPEGAGVEPDFAPLAPGVAGLLSKHRVIQVATAASLVDHGVHPQAALEIALLFSDVGSAGAAYGGLPDLQRLPGELYRDGRTILGVWRCPEGRFRGWEARVINAVHTDNHDMVQQKLLTGFPAPARPLRLILVDCADVLQQLKPLFDAPRDPEAAAARWRAAILAQAAATEERISRRIAGWDGEGTTVPRAAPKKTRTQTREPVTTR